MNLVIWEYDKCLVCGQKFKYPRGARNPKVCPSYDCVHKKAHDPKYEEKKQ